LLEERYKGIITEALFKAITEQELGIKSRTPLPKLTEPTITESTNTEPKRILDFN